MVFSIFLRPNPTELNVNTVISLTEMKELRKSGASPSLIIAVLLWDLTEVIIEIHT